MLAILVPTMTWVRLRLPGLSRTVEFICLLPLTVPAIVLVVGLTPVYAWVYYFVGSSTLWLSLAYVVLVHFLPAYRSLDAGLRAIDVRTLSEAARSLGASWFTVMRRIVLPNLRSAVLSASFLSVALVLGEFTIASLFSKRTSRSRCTSSASPTRRSRSPSDWSRWCSPSFRRAVAMSFVGKQPCRHLPLARFRRTRVDRKEPAA